MAVKIATNPIAWTNDDVPGVGKEITLQTCLEQASASGYEGIEMGGRFPRTSEELGLLLSSHNLTLASGWWEGLLLERGVTAEFEAMRPYLSVLKQLGVKHFVYGEGSRGRMDSLWKPMSQRPKLRDGEWADYVRDLSELAAKTADLGVGLALHPHIGTVIETDTEIDQVMRLAGPAVNLAFDTGHCLLSGGDPAAVCRRHAERIVHLHCKDVRTDKLSRAKTRDMSFMDSVLEGIFTVPGDGCIDFTEILQILQKAGYSGWLVVEAEQNPDKAPPYFFARLGYENLTKNARDVGLFDQGQAS